MLTGRTIFQSVVWRGLYYATAFIINILIARHFQASASGAIYYLSSIYALIVLFTSLSLESGIIYFSAREEIPVNKLLNFSLAWSLLAGAIIFSAGFVFFPDVYHQISRPFLIFSAVCFIFGNLLTTYCSGFFYARRNFIVPNLVNIICTVCLIIVLPYGGKSLVFSITNDNYFYIYFGSFLLQGILLAFAAGAKYVRGGLKVFLSVSEFKLLFRYCLLAFSGNILYFLLYRVDYWFVAKYCSPEQLGNYIQVSKLVQLFFILPTILASAVFPITAEGKKENISQLLTLLSRIIFFAYLLACIFLAMAGQWLFPFVFGESFSGMYQPFLLLIPGILSLSGLFTLTAYFAGKNQISTNIIGSVYALLIILAGDMFFIPRYGIKAAALVSSVGYMVYQAYVIVIFKKEFKIGLDRFFLVRTTDFVAIKKGLIESIKNAPSVS